MGNHVPKRVSPGHVTQVSVCPHKHVTRTYVLGCLCVPTSTSLGHLSPGVHVSPPTTHACPQDICPQVSMCPRVSHTHPHKDNRGAGGPGGGEDTPKDPKAGGTGGHYVPEKSWFNPKMRLLP